MATLSDIRLILKVGELVRNVYRAYAGAPEQFRDFSREILSLQVVVGKVEDQLLNQLQKYELSVKDTGDLKTLYDELKSTMEGLDALLKKYQNLAENPSISFDRVRWGQEDLAGLRDKVRSNITLVTAFNASLTNKYNIQLQAHQILATTGLRRAGSVASLYSIASFACSVRQKESWKQLCRELHSNGVTAVMIEAKKEEIIELFQSARVHEGISETTQGKHADQADWALFNDRIEMLPATQSRYFGAELDAKRLLGKLPNIDTRNAAGQTALHVAAAQGRADLGKVLLDRGADIDATTDGNTTAIHVAASEGHFEVVEALLDRGATIEAATKKKWTALHRASQEGHMHIEVVKVLLDRGAAINATTDRNATALHLAAREGHIDAVKVLLERGASSCVNAPDGNGWTPLRLAVVAQGGHIEVVKVLLDWGATIDHDSMANGNVTVLHVAAARGHLEVVKVLFERVGSSATMHLDFPGPWGNTALHYATRGCHGQMVELLLANGASTDQENTDGETALVMARQLHWKPGVKLLKAHTTKIAKITRRASQRSHQVDKIE